MNENRAPSSAFPMIAVGDTAAMACPNVVKYNGYTMQKKRNEKPAREESKPEVQYQQKKSIHELSMFHGISIRIWDTRNADQLNILEGRSRIS